MPADKDEGLNPISQGPQIVTAIVDEWRGSKNNYGFAEILTGHTAGATAFCFRTIGGVEVPLEEEFRCRIDSTEKGWKVVALHDDDLPTELLGVGGTVSFADRENKPPFWQIKVSNYVDGNPLSRALTVSLFTNVLRKRGLADLRDGATVVVNAERKSRGYVATEIISPGPEDVFPDLNPREVDAHAIGQWEAANVEDRYVDVGAGDPRAPAVVSIGISRTRLITAGIRLVVPGAEPCEGRPAELQKELLLAPRETLVPIDAFRLEIEWEAKRSRWTVRKLLEPRCIRISSEGEVIDWVAGTIEAFEDAPEKTEEFEGSVPSDDPLPKVAKGAPAKPEFLVAVDDPRVGRGTVRLYKKVIGFEHAECAPGVPVVLSLRGYKTGWTAHAIHRSIPHTNSDS